MFQVVKITSSLIIFMLEKPDIFEMKASQNWEKSFEIRSKSVNKGTYIFRLLFLGHNVWQKCGPKRGQRRPRPRRLVM